jgi:hypothetical protein
MNYMYVFSIFGINCMLCLCLSSQIWKETYVCIFIVIFWEGSTPPTRSHPEIGEGLPCARLVISPELPSTAMHAIC